MQTAPWSVGEWSLAMTVCLSVCRAVCQAPPAAACSPATHYSQPGSQAAGRARRLQAPHTTFLFSIFIHLMPKLVCLLASRPMLASVCFGC